jgi:chromate transporter
MCIPSFAIIYVISLFLNRFLEIEIIASAFMGIQVGVIFIIFMAGLKMLKNMKKTAFNITILSLTVVISVVFSIMMVNFSAIFYILFSGFLGLVIYLIGYFKNKGDKRK